MDGYACSNETDPLCEGGSADMHGHIHESGHDHACAHDSQKHSGAQVLSCARGQAVMEIHEHEGAVVASFAIELGIGVTLRSSDLADVLVRLAQAAERQGGIVGHVKAFVDGGAANSFHISVIDAMAGAVATGSVSALIDESSEIQIAAIVLCVEKDSFVADAKEIVSTLLA